jgi:hypothetical protein
MHDLAGIRRVGVNADWYKPTISLRVHRIAEAGAAGVGIGAPLVVSATGALGHFNKADEPLVERRWCGRSVAKGRSPATLHRLKHSGVIRMISVGGLC